MATSRPRDATLRAASSTAITRVFARFGKAPNMNTSSLSRTRFPAIREKVSEHMALRGLPREKVLATVVIFWKPR